MVAPTPVSALLHAVAVVKAGVFSVLKVVVYVFGIDFLRENGSGDWLLYAAGATVLIASVIALRQDNLKKRLAYSTVSQLSYVILATAILVPISAVGAAMHIAAHAVSKITLFFAAGSIYTAAHYTEISQLNGIGRRMPWTMAAFGIGAISMIGVPPTAGFLGKWFMFLGAMETQAWVAVGVIITSTLLNAAYFLPIVVRAFFVAPDKGSREHGEAPLPIVIALTATAAATVLLFLFPERSAGPRARHGRRLGDGRSLARTPQDNQGTCGGAVAAFLHSRFSLTWLFIIIRILVSTEHLVSRHGSVS